MTRALQIQDIVVGTSNCNRKQHETEKSVSYDGTEMSLFYILPWHGDCQTIHGYRLLTATSLNHLKFVPIWDPLTMKVFRYGYNVRRQKLIRWIR